MTFRDRIGSLGNWTFWLWAAVGVGFGCVISVIGVFTVLPSVVATIFLLRRPRFRESVFGILVGIGAVLLLIAYINRGPGDFNARHWLLAGLGFVLAGVLAQMFAAAPRASRA